jgi:hypothetical protein
MGVMIKIRTLLASVLAGSLLAISVSLPAFAAASSGITLTTTPVSSELNAAPGGSVTTTLQVMNNSSAALNINVQLDTFKADGTSGQGQVVTNVAKDPFIKWVTFSQTSFVAQPGVWTPVQMTIHVPSTAALDYYYAVVFKPSISTSAKHVNVLKTSNAILILLNVNNGHENPQVKVTSFTSASKLYEYLPATFNITVANTGNVYLPPSGDIYISKHSNFSSIIDTIQINAAGGNVLPGTSRVYSAKWTDGFPVFTPETVGGQPVENSQGQPIDQLKWNFSQIHKLRFGKYYAKMVLVYNNGTQDIPIQSSVSFWVIPWKVMLGLILLIACIITGITLFVLKYRKLTRINKKPNKKTDKKTDINPKKKIKISTI